MFNSRKLPSSIFKRQNRSLLLNFFVACFFFLILHNDIFAATECKNCGNKFENQILGKKKSQQEPSLSFCPFCGSKELVTPNVVVKQKSSLSIEIEYKGRFPGRLPPYGLVYLNERLIGRLKKRGSQFFFSTDNILPGVYDVRLRMRFFRWYGLKPEYKWKKFSYMGFKPGEKTKLSYNWEQNRHFGKRRTPADKSSNLFKLRGFK